MNAGMDKALLAQNYRPVPSVEGDLDKAALKERTDQFEALMIKMMLDNAMKDEKNLFSGKDPGERIYKSMYRDELSKAGAGGFGFSQMLFDYLSTKGNSH